MVLIAFALALAPVFFFSTVAPAATLPVRVNFQPEGSAVPSGYAKDSGLPYDAARGSGWVRPGTQEPVDMTKNTRERTSPSDQRLRTLVLMQGTGVATQPNRGSWEYAVPNGAYEVTASVGDSAFFDGTDGVDVEGEAVIPVFQRSTAEAHRSGSGTVTVSDGRLTVQATGTNTKLNFIDIEAAEPTGTPSNAEIEVQNLDGVPFNDRLAFSRIQKPETGTRLKNDGTCCVPANGVHDTATLRVKNTGSDPLNVTGLPVSGPWEIVGGPTLPATVPVGGQLDIKTRFVAQEIGARGGLYDGTLTVQSNDADEPSTSVQLSGFWQKVSEGGQEPTFGEVARGVFGYATTILNPGQGLNKSGRIQAVGEEVISPYWQRADTSKPVGVTQIAAYHGQGNTATFFWTNKGQRNGTTVLVHNGLDGQTVLPRKAGSTTALARTTFTPTAETFGLRADIEHSDPTLNNREIDYDNLCPRPAPGELETCGHHVRFWPVRDRSGAVVPNSWIMLMDYAGINYDYNDNIYLVENVKPEQGALYRLDVAGSTSSTYRDTASNFWTPDTGLYAPETARAEGANTAPQEIANTNDDVLYRTYRGNVGNVPLDQRVLTYDLPTKGLQKVDVKLHFAERFWQASGKRIFDIEAEGRLLRDNFDIFAVAGGSNRATTLQFNDVAVTDGKLTLAFRAETDYPSVAAIEVLCEGTCPPPPSDTTRPATPTGLTATASQSGIALNWSDNSEPDVAGYVVSRATSATGSFERIHSSLLTSSEYLDQTATAGSTYYYKVIAVDKEVNKSASSATVSATRPG